MKLHLPPDISGGNPTQLIEHLGMRVDRPAHSPDTLWEVSAPTRTLVATQTLYGPALSRSRFDVSTAPTPGVPGGMPASMIDLYQRLNSFLEDAGTLPAKLDLITQKLVAVADQDVPAAIEWGSTTLSSLVIEGTSDPLFPRHSVHDVRVAELLYRWIKLPQLFLRLHHHTVAEIIADATTRGSNGLTFQASGALTEGTVFGGHYFAPLLANLCPRMWGFGAPRIGQTIIYTFGRSINGRGTGASRDPLDTHRALAHHTPLHEFAKPHFDETRLHKAAYSEAVDWWATRINNTLLDLYSPTNYVDSKGFYVPAVHQRWMLNFEELVNRISAILRNPRDTAAQLMLLFPTMDILKDSFTGSNSLGQLMEPTRLRKRITAVQSHVPVRIAPLILDPAHRALTAAEQVSDEFFIASPDPGATVESRLRSFWNARRNTVHGYNTNANAEILAEHTGRLPADIVLTPMIYLLDILTDRQGLLKRVRSTCG